ncbi:MAG: hypothetical protein JNK73_15210 [Bacteroidia bacterium]|nr:hypothetical protein [Bacteroidia bacterium]
MKKTLLISAFCLYSISTNAQKCVENLDPVSNKKQVIFDDENKFYSTRFELKEGRLLLTKPFYYIGDVSVKVPTGTEFIFKLENGELITLKTITETIGKGSVDQTVVGGIITTFNFTFELTKEQVNKFAASPIIFIRRPKVSEGGTEDLDKKDRHVKKSKDSMQKGAACIITYM